MKGRAGKSRHPQSPKPAAVPRSGLWLRLGDEELTCHDVSLEAVPASPARFKVFVRFAWEGCDNEELALGLLRASLSLYYYGGIASATDGDLFCWPEEGREPLG